MLARPPVRCLLRPVCAVGRGARRTLILRQRPQGAGRAQERLNIGRLSQQHDDYHRNRRSFLVAGVLAGTVSFLYTAWKLRDELAKKPKLDTTLPSTDPLLAPPTEGGRKVVLHDKQGREIVPTGNSVVSDFPRTIELPSSFAPALSQPADATVEHASHSSQQTEYTLVGLGLRTVSFLGIQVYILGYYVATQDIADLQAALVKKINPIATTLVPAERDQLREVLLDHTRGEATWDGLLRDGIPARSVVRIVPIRDTDFHHLRDGFVRAIQSRSDKVIAEASSAPGHVDDFGESVRTFRSFFERGQMPKRKELLLLRDAAGSLSIVYNGPTGQGSTRAGAMQLLGTVSDERLSRALWLNYLAGKKVASEPARINIVNGIMELVERPVGTVATQVV